MSGEIRAVDKALGNEDGPVSFYFLFLAVTGLYPEFPAFFIAAMPSSTVSSGVVFTLLQAPPAAMASAKAAALALFGISMMVTTS